MRIAIFRTSRATLPGVLKHQKHALQGEPNLARGDLVLISKTVEGLKPSEKRINHRMTYLRSYRDGENESDKIWGRHWRFIIECNGLKLLRRPFNIAEVPGIIGIYAQGGPIMYIDPHDEKVLLRGGYFEPADGEP